MRRYYGWATAFVDPVQLMAAVLAIMVLVFMSGTASACHNPTRGSGKHNPVATVTHAAIVLPVRAAKAAVEIATAPVKIAGNAVFGTQCANGQCATSGSSGWYLGKWRGK